MSGQLIALYKNLGIRPVGIGETWIRLMEKCLIQVTGKEATSTCRMEQLARGVKVGIEGDIHSVRVLWQEHLQEEDKGFLLIDA